MIYQPRTLGRYRHQCRKSLAGKSSCACLTCQCTGSRAGTAHSRSGLRLRTSHRRTLEAHQWSPLRSNQQVRSDNGSCQQRSNNPVGTPLACPNGHSGKRSLLGNQRKLCRLSVGFRRRRRMLKYRPRSWLQLGSPRRKLHRPQTWFPPRRLWDSNWAAHRSFLQGTLCMRFALLRYTSLSRTCGEPSLPQGRSIRAGRCCSEVHRKDYRCLMSSMQSCSSSRHTSSQGGTQDSCSCQQSSMSPKDRQKMSHRYS